MVGELGIEAFQVAQIAGPVSFFVACWTGGFLLEPAIMDSEDFIRWALDPARTVEERYTTELLVEQSVN